MYFYNCYYYILVSDLVWELLSNSNRRNAKGSKCGIFNVEMLFLNFVNNNLFLNLVVQGR